MEELVENEDEEEMSGEYEMDTGVLDTISQQFESLDYFTNYSSLLLDEIRMRGYKFVIRKVREDLSCDQWPHSLLLSGRTEVVNNALSRRDHRLDRLLYRHHYRGAGQLQVRGPQRVDGPLCPGAV